MTSIEIINLRNHLIDLRKTATTNTMRNNLTDSINHLNRQIIKEQKKTYINY